MNFGSVIGLHKVKLTKLDKDHFYYGTYLVDVPLLQHELYTLDKSGRVPKNALVNSSMYSCNGGAGIAHYGGPSLSNLRRIARELHEGKEPEGPAAEYSLNSLRMCGLKISKDTIENGR
jgi:hypothetical protein